MNHRITIAPSSRRDWMAQQTCGGVWYQEPCSRSLNSKGTKMNFRDSYVAEANKATGLRKRRMLKIADDPAKMARLESATRNRLGFNAREKIDWSKIDMAKIMKWIEGIAAILKLFA